MAPKKKPAVAEKKPVAAKKGTTEAKAPAAPAAPDATASVAPAADKGSRVIGALPVELVTNRVLTHYDETAGVAIARWEVDSHKGIGNVVVPLPDAFKTRYERLRTILTGKLLPKREHLLQLRRSLQSTSIEVDATRRNIERETQTDSEQIIERLRSLESMRQSAIKHEVMKLEEELQIIERLVRRVEQANIDETEQLSTTAVLLTSAYPGTVPAVESIRTPKAVAMVELIQEFGDLYASINQQANKPVSVQVEFPTNDFPRETTERLEVMGRCDKYLHAVSVKDHMLWKALQEKEKAEEDLAAERRLIQEYSQEILAWAEQTRALKQENIMLRQEHDQVVMRNRDLMRVLREYNISYQEDS
jgi:hypothetical protein